MPEETKPAQTEQPIKSEVLYTKRVELKTNQGNTKGVIQVDKKSINGHQFVQITNEKYPFGNTPGKKTYTTIPVGNDDVILALKEALNN